MGYTVDLLTGLAEYLDAGGVGTWRGDGTAYAADEIAIVIGPNLPQSPDRVICLTPYPVSDTPGMPEVVTGVQVRVRGTTDTTVAEDLADEVYDLLHGASGLTLGGVPVAQMWRNSASLLGPDTNHRAERADNYYLQATRVAFHSID